MAHVPQRVVLPTGLDDDAIYRVAHFASPLLDQALFSGDARAVRVMAQRQCLAPFTSALS